MNHELSNKQRIRFFLTSASAFAALFVLLGIIVFQLLQVSAYNQTDMSLSEMTTNRTLIEREISRLNQSDPFIDFPLDKPFPEGFTPQEELFNTQIILWTENGEILNKEVLGGRYTQLNTLTLDATKLNEIIPVVLAESNLSFRSITIENSESLSSEVAYIQFLTNTNQIDDSLTTFQWILFVCMFIFWLISLGVSVFSSKMNMKPLLIAWQKQQEFVENASHELRTPLTIIQNNLQHLFTRPNQTILEQSPRIAQALSETRRLTNLTNDLLLIARSDGNQATIQPEETDIDRFLAQLIQPFVEIAEMQDKTFHFTNEISEPLSFDASKIHQVLVILLDNALKYTQAKDEIQLVAKQINPKWWQVVVRNTGSTIPDTQKKLIFERFYREEQSRNQETGGYGLGLAIAKQIVKNHHGKLFVSDWTNQGVQFTLQLPIIQKNLHTEKN
ncbi:MAG: HAMP domain-containing histidine kinase [Enterococcus aquimarinus]|uniref:histidine kinase n=1 Tax=Enterococcus aquimarinus TaxID=328396 RepID=A0A9E3ZT41_9ENTE|nr:HAMP domain-containing histidine kinase [Enterococcus aquimarinus]